MIAALVAGHSRVRTEGNLPEEVYVRRPDENQSWLAEGKLDVDTDPLSLLIGSKQESDLLQQVQVVSTEFADRPILTNGKLTQFLGFDIIVSERLSPGTASLRQCYAWAKSGMYLGMWKDMEVQMDRRIDLSSQPWQIYAKHMYGATRTQLGKVIQILAADTTGADITP